VTEPPPAFAPFGLDDALLEEAARSGSARLDLFVPEEVLVVLGRGSRPGAELRLEACEADGVCVRRRRGGGCAVVLDPGDLVVSLALLVPGIGDNRRHFARISEWLLDGLARAGISGVRREGSSDLAVADRKVGGACISRRRGLLHYGASLLVDPDVGLMERYLRHPPREPAYRAGRSHRDFVGALLPSSGPEGARSLAQTLGATLRLGEI
jgi:lipoate-protein ligase A